MPLENFWKLFCTQKRVQLQRENVNITVSQKRKFHHLRTQQCLLSALFLEGRLFTTLNVQKTHFLQLLWHYSYLTDVKENHLSNVFYKSLWFHTNNSRFNWILDAIQSLIRSYKIAHFTCSCEYQKSIFKSCWAENS